MLNRLRNDSAPFSSFFFPQIAQHDLTTTVLIKLSSIAFLETRDSFLTYPIFSRRLLISGKNGTDINENFAKEFRPRFLSRFKPARILVWNRFHPSFDTFDVTETLQIGASFFSSTNFQAFLLTFVPYWSQLTLGFFLFRILKFFTKIIKEMKVNSFFIKWLYNDNMIMINDKMIIF